jgi:predicted unusual protein kinase regulating ubiquinone biosynthesis (AarF/ABC1/UbiB family)
VADSGADLVLKVQYPELPAVIDDDFDAVVRMLRMSRWLPASRDFDAWLEEMRGQLHREIDYPREIAMAEQMAAASAQQPIDVPDTVPLRIPRYWSEYSADALLAMDWMEGLRVTEPQVAALPLATRTALGKTMLALFFREVFDWGLMQTDPNFGNYLIGENGGSLALLDFGSVERLDEGFRSALADVILGGQLRDHTTVLRGLRALGCLKRGASDYAEQTFVGFVEHLLEPLAHPSHLPEEYLNADGHYCWARSALMQRAGKKAAGSAASRHFDTPSGDFALLARKLTGVFTFISVLGAEFNGYDVLEPYLTERERAAS